jgi:carotenoid cleavage oxygenase
MDSPFLTENFRPVREEISTGPLTVTGSIPGHLDGRYLRIGPNPIADVDPATYHWFLGDGMVHGVRLRDGKAQWYRSRYVRSADAMRRLGEPLPEDQTRRGTSPNPRHQARVGVLPRDGGSADVRWFDVNPCYVFHPLNAYEADDTLVLDVVRHERVFSTEMRGPAEGTPTLDRWTVDLLAGKVLESRLDDRDQEFPRIDERLTGHPHRYGYTVNSGSGENYVIKHDFAPGDNAVRSLGSRRQTSEFSFIPDRPDAAEDEGTLIGYVYDRDTDRSDLVLLNAGTLEDVAAIHLPARVPQGFHGNWIPVT